MTDPMSWPRLMYSISSVINRKGSEKNRNYHAAVFFQVNFRQTQFASPGVTKFFALVDE